MIKRIAIPMSFRFRYLSFSRCDEAEGDTAGEISNALVVTLGVGTEGDEES